MKNKGISKIQALKNVNYAWKLLVGSSKSRAVHLVITSLYNYLEWIFYSAVFMRFVISAIENQKSFSEILFFIIAVSAFFMIGVVYNIYVENVSNPITGIKIYKNIYSKIYKKAERVDLSCYENADFYNKYTMAIDKADTKIVDAAENFIKMIVGFIALIVVTYIMFSIDSFVIIFIIFPVLGNFVFGNVMNKLYYNRYKDSVSYQRKSDYVNRVMYLSDFAKEIRLTNVFKIVQRDYNDAVKGIEKVTDKYSKKATVFSFLQTYFTYTLIFEGVLIYGSYCALYRHSMPFADLAVLTSIMTTVSWILIGFTESLMKIIENGMFIQNLRGFLEYEEKITEDENSLPAPEKIESIEFNNVTFSYEEKPVLDNLSFKIYGDEKIALVGINGAGKTTIVKLLLRLYDPDNGEIMLNGVDIKEYKLSEYRKLFSCAFQDFKIFADSLNGNISMGRNIAGDNIDSIIKRVGLFETVEQLENGAKTILSKEYDDNGIVFSGGQQQKVAVARAFANVTPIKVFDEPSSALDPIAEYEIFKNILNESKGYTTIFISHRLSTVKSADRVFMLEDGKVIESGSHNELIEKQGKYAQMYNYQARNYLADEDYDELAQISKKEVVC